MTAAPRANRDEARVTIWHIGGAGVTSESVSFRSVAAACVVGIAAVAACGDGAPSDPPPASDAGAPDGAIDVVTDDGARPPFGLDARPANPTCRAPARPISPKVAARWTRTFPSLTLPANVVDLVKLPGGRFYVVEREGLLLAFEPTPAVSTFSTALDIRAKVDQGFEAGLLSFVLHPKVAQNGFAYVYYTRNDGVAFYARVARVHTTDGGATFDPSSEKTILEWPIGATGTGHTGGRLLFGPDGFLYLSTGDALTPADAQNVSNVTCASHTPCALQGKMLRIDVDKGDPYAIPLDNPFAAGGGKKEIFAWGLRNVFRYSFDRATGDLWAADVGDQKWDEVDRIERGGNYGWPRAEGKDCADGSGCAGLVGPEFQTMNVASPACADPLDCAAASVGGYVYRGAAIPELRGAYLYGDFAIGTQWALVRDEAGSLVRISLAGEAGSPPVNAAGYAEDDAGELFAIDYNGLVYRLERAGSEPPPASPFPQKLSDTGCVSTSDPTALAPGVVPYDVIVPSFSAGATVARAFAIPDGTTMGIGADADLDLPNGSVVMQTFRVGGAPIETRLLVRHDDGAWAGYSYEWNADGRDATLLDGGKVKRTGGTSWTFPSRTDCVACHTKAAGGTLGLEVAQLGRAVDYPSRPGSDQLATLDHVGFFGAPVPKVAPFPALGSSAAVDLRARAMLHARCSSCHRAGATPTTALDLRFSTPLSATKTCNVPPSRGDMGIANAKLLAPGAPALSILVQRTARSDVWRMPNVGARVVDDEATALLDALARATTSCP